MLENQMIKYRQNVWFASYMMYFYEWNMYIEGFHFATGLWWTVTSPKFVPVTVDTKWKKREEERLIRC